jgi:uncharacterized delta-60 repeat protein
LLSKVKTAINTASLPAAYMPIPAQVNASGKLDNHFGANGWRWLRSNTSTDDFLNTTIAAQPDGKVVVASTSGGGGLVTVMRLNTDGELDSSFGTNGIASFDVFTNNAGDPTNYPRFSNARIWDAAIQEDGKIVLAGEASHLLPFPSSISQVHLFVMRLNSSGTMDTSFSGDGFAGFTQNSHELFGRAVAVKGTGANAQIVVAGISSAIDSTLTDFVIARILDNGTLDSGFNGSGVTLVDFQHLETIDLIPTVISNEDEAYDVAIDSNNRIVAVGKTVDRLAVIRLNSTGSEDIRFNGSVNLPNVPQLVGQLNAVSILPNDSFVVGGQVYTGSSFDYLIAKITNAGVLDTSFGGGDGYAFGDYGSGSNPDDKMLSLSVLADGSIIGAGIHKPDASSGANVDTALVKFTTAGVLDTTFGTSGHALENLAGSGIETDSASKIVISGSKVVTVGRARVPQLSKWRIAVARFNP